MASKGNINLVHCLFPEPENTKLVNDVVSKLYKIYCCMLNCNILDFIVCIYLLIDLLEMKMLVI